MTEDQLLELRPGDEVHWDDPDEGRGSRLIKIQKIRLDLHNTGTVQIWDAEGGYLEAFPDELR